MLPEPVRLSQDMNTDVCSMIARWGHTEKTVTRIVNLLAEEYNVITQPEEIHRIATANTKKIVRIRKRQREGLAQETHKMLNKTQYLIARQLDRSMKDADTLDLLDHLLDAEAIDEREHRKRAKRLRVLSVGDLLKIANHFLAQSPHTPPSPEVIPPTNANTPPAMSDHKAEEIPFNQQLLDAMKKGDEVEVQRILFKPNQSDEPAEKL